MAKHKHDWQHVESKNCSMPASHLIKGASYEAYYPAQFAIFVCPFCGKKKEIEY